MADRITLDTSRDDQDVVEKSEKGSTRVVTHPRHNETPSLQQKRGAQERLRLNLPKHIITSPEEHSASNSVHFVENSEENSTTKQSAPGHHYWQRKTPYPDIEESKPKWQEPKSKSKFKLPNLEWIPQNFNVICLRPVLRCSIFAWISLLLILIPRTQKFLGKSSFIILPASFLSPPSDPFIAVLEREIIIQLTVSGSYAWSCLGIKLANLARTEFSTNVDVSDVLRGRYLEVAPSVICCIFLCLGTSILLYLRTMMGQGKPVIAAMILSCTVMDSSLTAAPLYPFPNYQLGKDFVVPIAFHSINAIACALLIFPESVHAQFRRRSNAVFSPLSEALRDQAKLLQNAPSIFDADFEAGVESYTQRVQAAEAALGPLGMTSRLMKKDCSFGRFSPGDFRVIHELARRMTVRANGMAFYFKIMDPSRHRFPGTPATTPSYSRTSSRAPSAPSTPRVENCKSTGGTGHNNGSISSRRRRTHQASNYFQSQHRHSNPKAHLHDMLSRPLEHAVGVFESQAYLNLESRFEHANADYLRSCFMKTLGTSAEPLLLCCADAIDHASSWFQRVKDDGLLRRLTTRNSRLRWDVIVHENEIKKEQLVSVLNEFRNTRRHQVLDVYRPVFSPGRTDSPGAEDPPPHRYLFQCYLYQYHLIHLALDHIKVLDEITRLETTRRRSRLWLPSRPFRKIFGQSKWDSSNGDVNPGDEEDPDLVAGIEPDNVQLGEASRRDPDALPPRSIFGRVCRMVYLMIHSLGHGNAVFAFKAGVMAVLLALPSYLPRSMEIAISNRSVWAIVLGQTTLSRFRGDTVFGLTSRILSTFFGGVVGMIIWYISAGSGTGNAYILGVICALCFPFFYFARIYYPGPPINVIFFFLTSQLVIGYSWQDTHLPSITEAGYGFTVAWKRFLMVTIGVTVAFIFSILPPSTTLRRYLRRTYATTASQIGQLYCDILSMATVRDAVRTEKIVKNLIAVRMKLGRTRALRRNVAFEFSLQGEWPADRYKRILEIQMEIAYLLSHLRSVEEHLDPEWARAFLRRTRFMESDFQGDILSVICMISIALRTGTPLPQITPCPLLDRFVAHNVGMDDYGLPRTLNIETLENEQYLNFSVGVATAFGIITRLDRLMLATKELVGEQYHIRGVIDLSRKRNAEKTNL